MYAELKELASHRKGQRGEVASTLDRSSEAAVSVKDARLTKRNDDNAL